MSIVGTYQMSISDLQSIGANSCNQITANKPNILKGKGELMEFLSLRQVFQIHDYCEV